MAERHRPVAELRPPPADQVPEEESAPFRPATRRDRIEELIIVLSLTLLSSAVYALINLLSAPVNSGVIVAVFSNSDLARQVTGIVFALVPVWLVFYLIRRNGESLETFGLDTRTLRSDAGWGVLLGLGVSVLGLGIYLAAIALNVNRFVVPVPPLGYWWSIPILVLGSVQNGLLEEIVVVGYMIPRLEQVGMRDAYAILTSAVLRGSYHLYQGWGGFTGNLLMGLLFGTIFVRWRRTWPLVIAHATIDTLAGLAYIAFRGHCFGGLCIPR
jgi:membrane protease YdiL (CAAX protease family)